LELLDAELPMPDFAAGLESQGGIAEFTARVLEWKSNVLTRREPTATVEGVRIARRATALSADKARRELGYVPRPIEPLLREMIALMSGASVSEVLKHA